MFYLNEDRSRVTLAGGFGTVHFQFYLDNPIGGWIPYQREASFAGIEDWGIYFQIGEAF